MIVFLIFSVYMEQFCFWKLCCVDLAAEFLPSD